MRSIQDSYMVSICSSSLWASSLWTGAVSLSLWSSFDGLTLPFAGGSSWSSAFATWPFSVFILFSVGALDGTRKIKRFAILLGGFWVRCVLYTVRLPYAYGACTFTILSSLVYLWFGYCWYSFCLGSCWFSLFCSGVVAAVVFDSTLLYSRCALRDHLIRLLYLLLVRCMVLLVLCMVWWIKNMNYC